MPSLVVGRATPEVVIEVTSVSEVITPERKLSVVVKSKSLVLIVSSITSSPDLEIFSP